MGLTRPGANTDSKLLIYGLFQKGRVLAQDGAAERTSTPREVVEAALAHTVQNPTKAAYARSDLFERRRRLMDDWAAYLSGAHGQVWHDDGNQASRPGVLPTLQPTSR